MLPEKEWEKEVMRRGSQARVDEAMEGPVEEEESEEGHPAKPAQDHGIVRKAHAHPLDTPSVGLRGVPPAGDAVRTTVAPRTKTEAKCQ